MLPTTLTGLIVSFLDIFTGRDSFFVPAPASPAPRAAKLQFQLRHLHAVSPSAHVVFSDVTPHSTSRRSVLYDNITTPESLSPSTQTTYSLQTRPLRTHRLKSFQSHSEARSRSLRYQESTPAFQLWDEPEEVDGPDVENRQTLLELAKMTNNAYLEPDQDGWYDLDGPWNVSYPFGWEPNADGFRGHVFATPDNSTVVLSIKGTSAGFFGSGGPTVKKDKLNDNLLFSCCCARVDFTWSVVCDCWRGGGKCDARCLEDALVEESLFYPIGTNLYNNLTYMYPDSDIWVIGHSLGGALGSLLGATFGAPVVTFESPGEKMAAERLHLPSPPSTHHITHVYHTADPIAMGTCTGVLSSCALAGYALESRCHLGKMIRYDTVSVLDWGVDVRRHGIVNIIEKVLAEPWPPSVEENREVPEAKAEEDCVECYSYEFGDFP
ncbi:alpha/beta-hydrolase [Pleurotus eryngii]|uniref:triacylglycerol lipase n=1 Tax=Pleurotus eryngii TaxID=5323 RepID=A0A9P5ZZZ0_PLEER|nr:alpha/beta-hydrolase [Pleurotus eryngii]